MSVSVSEERERWELLPGAGLGPLRFGMDQRRDGAEAWAAQWLFGVPASETFPAK